MSRTPPYRPEEYGEGMERAFTNRHSKKTRVLTPQQDVKSAASEFEFCKLVGIDYEEYRPTKPHGGWQFTMPNGVRVKVYAAPKDGNLLQVQRSGYADVFVLFWIDENTRQFVGWCEQHLVLASDPRYIRKDALPAHRVPWKYLDRDTAALKVRLGLMEGQVGLL